MFFESLTIKLSVLIIIIIIIMINSICKNIYLAGADLPDDDYTTLVPQSKPINSNSSNPSKIQIIIEDKENNTTSTKSF